MDAKQSLIALALAVVLMMSAKAVDLQFGEIQLRKLYLEYSFDLTNWNWWGTLETTNDGIRTTLVMEEHSTNVPSKTWRMRDASTNAPR